MLELYLFFIFCNLLQIQQRCTKFHMDHVPNKKKRTVSYCSPYIVLSKENKFYLSCSNYVFILFYSIDRYLFVILKYNNFMT